MRSLAIVALILAMSCSPALARIVINPAPPPSDGSEVQCLWVTTLGSDGCYCVVGGVRQEPIGELEVPDAPSMPEAP
jgi:hypothetical protein